MGLCPNGCMRVCVCLHSTPENGGIPFDFPFKPRKGVPAKTHKRRPKRGFGVRGARLLPTTRVRLEWRIGAVNLANRV